MGDEDVLILNDGLEQRTSKTGKQRYTIKVTSEPLIFNLDPKQLGAPVAQALAHHFRERIRGITASASAATIKARAVAAKAYALGNPWALKRYSGGRTGAMPPSQHGDKAFNDSGRFAETLVAGASSDGAWRINVAANRLSAETGAIDRIYKRLTELVPEILNPAQIDNAVLRRVIENTQRAVVQKARAQTGKVSIAAIRATLNLIRDIGGLTDVG